ncbi:MAG: hypothetical protein FWF58_05485 [Firmicutes bacterium]|nr:hypothetical protein [Bacillota bacterium]
MQKSIKKIGLLLLVLALSAPFLVGCADFFFEKQNQRDMQQIVASIPIQDQKLQNYRNESAGDVVYKSRSIDIYKGALVTKFNTDKDTLMQDESVTQEDAVRISLEELIFEEIENAYMEIEFAKGEASKAMPKEQEWVDDIPQHQFLRQGVQWKPLVDEDDNKSGDDFVNVNKVLQQVYQALQTEIFTVGNQILKERGESERPSVEQPDPTTPPNKFPTPPDTEHIAEPTMWMPDYFPGDNPDEYYKSLDIAAFRRVLTTFSKNLDNDYRLSADDIKVQREQISNIQDLIDSGEYKQAYNKLGKDLDANPEKSVLYWAVGRTAYRTIQKEVFTQWLNDSIEDGITDLDIQERYSSMLAQQQQQYTSDPTSFNTLADSSDLILYEPTSELFWVKHILLQFSESQQAELKVIKANANSKQEFEEQRQRLADNIVVEVRKDGWNTGVFKTASQAFEEIQANLKGKEGSTFEANSAFDTMIYKYNNDGGIFDKLDRGYLVQPGRNNDAKPGDEDDKYGLDLQWVVEFARAARDLRRDYDNGTGGLGAISGMVTTDNGIHILYLSDVTRGGLPNGKVYALGDWTSAAHTKTVRDAIKDLIANERQKDAQTVWRNNVLMGFDVKGKVTRYDSRYNDLW